MKACISCGREAAKPLCEECAYEMTNNTELQKANRNLSRAQAFYFVAGIFCIIVYGCMIIKWLMR